MDVTIGNDSLILRSDEDGVAVMMLNAPKSNNALSEAMGLVNRFVPLAEPMPEWTGA